MGLDGVELIMAYEETFNVQFTDEDAVRMLTPGDVIEFIASRVPLIEDASCLEQRGFHDLPARAPNGLTLSRANPHATE